MAEINGVKWHVIPGGQRLTTVINPAGTGFDDVWEVSYQIDTGPGAGTSGQVRIPAHQYTADVVKATINQLVSHQHGIASL